MVDGIHRARDATTGRVVAERLRVADTHWTRLRGLLGTRRFEAGDGLWITPCRQVHMIGMRFSVDVAFLDEEQRVVRTVEALPPGRISPKVSEASSVLELPAGTVQRTGVVEGSRIEIEGSAGRAVRKSASLIEPLVGNMLLALLYVHFAWTHVAYGERTGEWMTVMPLVAQEALLVLLFLTRRQSSLTSTRPVDWAVGITGMWLPLTLRARDVPGALTWLGTPLQLVGLSLAVLGVTSLGRSIGVVAANRGIKTRGLYRAVRHPMYGAHILGYLGYVASHPSPRNIIITAATILALNARAIAEERLLARDPVYRDYLRRTRWRFAPYVY